MSKPLSRRDFLKLLVSQSPGMFLPKFVQAPARYLDNAEAKNILIVVFDTFSAKHISLHGYQRETTPNLARIAGRATVYHNHYAGGNWTAPGTATLLTGMYPWSHRVFSQRDFVAKDKEQRNIFKVLDHYYRIGYSHNSIVDRFLNQFSNDLDSIKPQKSLFRENPLSLDRFFQLDGDIASLSWDRIVKIGEKGYTYSLFFADLFEKYDQRLVNDFLEDFPRGVPHIGEDDYFLLEDAINWLIPELNLIRQPFLAYVHYLPPHRPYNTRREFVDVFLNDGVDHHIKKPKHPLFSQSDVDKPLNLNYQSVQRQLYDEFILYTDAEFGRLYDSMEQNGLLENTWIIFTSDHGELFERGIYGHRTPVLYQPVIQIPLLIVEPGQKEKRDVFTPTSAVDILPTLLKITDQEIPDWAEGKVLPPFSSDSAEGGRSIYALEATDSNENEPLNPASVMLVKGKYKLTYYFGYEELDGNLLYELYDLENDPEELNNLYDPDSEISQMLRMELLGKIKEVDGPYQKN